MADESHSNTLRDYFTLQRGTTYKSRLLGQPGPVLLGLASIRRNGGFRPDSLRTYGGDAPENLLVRPGELYASLKDVTQSADLLGAVAKLPDGYGSGRLTQDTVRLEPKSDDVPTDYVYWLLRTPQYRAYCRAHSTGTTNLGLPRDDFLALPVPPYTTLRQNIVDALTALDSKIELNRRMNQTLLSTARAVFKSWFVDFDPVRTNIDGRASALPNSIAAHFPHALVESAAGLLPQGWDGSEIDKEVDVVGGATPSTKEAAFWENGANHWATPKDLSTLSSPILLETGRKITDAGVKKINSGLLAGGAVLLSSRAPIGYLAIAEIRTAINQGFIAMVCSRRLSNLYVLCWCYENLNYIKSIAGGSTFSEISKRAFRALPVVVPSQRVLRSYEDIVRPFYNRMLSNTKECATLAINSRLTTCQTHFWSTSNPWPCRNSWPC